MTTPTMLEKAMRHLYTILLAAVLATTSAIALAQTATRIRGAITAVDATTLSVKSRRGEDLKIALTDATTVGVTTAVKFEDLRAGDYVGATAVKRADGKLVALEVHYLPPNAASGHFPWDLAPGSTMTNANVVEARIAAAGVRELTLKYKDGEQTIVVAPDTPVVRAVPGARSDLKVGETVFVAAQSADGRLTALRVQVSKDGVRPPQ